MTNLLIKDITGKERELSSDDIEYVQPTTAEDVSVVRTVLSGCSDRRKVDVSTKDIASRYPEFLSLPLLVFQGSESKDSLYKLGLVNFRKITQVVEEHRSCAIYFDSIDRENRRDIPKDIPMFTSVTFDELTATLGEAFAQLTSCCTGHRVLQHLGKLRAKYADGRESLWSFAEDPAEILGPIDADIPQAMPDDDSDIQINGVHPEPHA